MISTIEKTHAIEIWDLEFELIISQVKHHVITQKPPRDRQKQICHITKNQVMPLLSHVLVIYTYILRTNATHYYYMRFLYSEKSLTVTVTWILFPKCGTNDIHVLVFVCTCPFLTILYWKSYTLLHYNINDPCFIFYLNKLNE